jgi:hypothetical protein
VQLDRSVQRAGERGRWDQPLPQTDRGIVPRRLARPRRATQVVLAGGEEQRFSRQHSAVGQMDQPILEPADRAPPFDPRPRLFRQPQQFGVERPARQPGGKARQGGFDLPSSGDHAQAVNRMHVERGRVQPDRGEARQRIPSQKAAAHDVLRSLAAFDQQRTFPAPGEQDRRRRPGGAAASDQRCRSTHSRKGKRRRISA